MACQHPLIRPVLGAFRHIFACSCSSTSMINNHPMPSSPMDRSNQMEEEDAAEDHDDQSSSSVMVIDDDDDDENEEETGLISTFRGSSRRKSTRARDLKHIVNNLKHIVNDRRIDGNGEMDYLDEEHGSFVVRHLRSVAELHAIFRHLEVRWQLFNDSLCKFRDPESMLANCTDDVIWSTEHGEIIQGKTPELLYILQSLIEREVSLRVEIERIVRISPYGSPELALDEFGHCGTPTTLQIVQAKVAMEIFGLKPSSIHPIINGLASSPVTDCRGCHPYFILAHDNYTLKNIEGNVVEQGKRAILWQRFELSWYIRGCLCYPLPFNYHSIKCRAA